MKKHFYLLLMIACVLFSCRPEPIVPMVTTSPVTKVTETTAISGGTVTEDGGEEVTSRGVCWSVNQYPTINDSHTNDGNGTGVFISTLSDLTPNTTYYVRSYATNNVGTAYGNEISFKTSEQNEGGEGNEGG